MDSEMPTQYYEEAKDNAWGLISDEKYSQEDITETADVIQLLADKYNQFESQQETNTREEVLGKIQRMIREWIYNVAIEKGQDEATAQRAGGQIFTFGSYSLGVHGPGTDIDTLVVAPRFVDRDKHFFGTLVEMFEACPDVTELTPVQYSKVPIIKMIFMGVDIDLLFARTSAPQISDDLRSLREDSILKN